MRRHQSEVYLIFNTDLHCLCYVCSSKDVAQKLVKYMNSSFGSCHNYEIQSRVLIDNVLLKKIV